MIAPHGSAELHPLYVSDTTARESLSHDAETLPSLIVSSATAANTVMLGGGYFNPLDGFMSLNDTRCVCNDMRTSSGVFFPVPILNVCNETGPIEGAERIALRDPNVEGNPVLAVMDVATIEKLSQSDLDLIISKVYGTTDAKHPGVQEFLSQGNYLISGPIKVLNFSYFESDFPQTFRTAVQIRQEIDQRGWERVVAFQTRNPMHRAHEELCKIAMAAVEADGLVIHMLLGKLKPGDIPASVRDAAIRKMVEVYFEPNTAMITGYGFDMLYAGPREAVLHAVFRQNMGASHFIIGRDHAGVGEYYGAFDAQTIFDSPAVRGALQIEIFRADHTAYSKKLHRVVMMRDAPDHTVEDFVLLSGTRVREMLGQGVAPPTEFTRPEVAKILMDYYQLKDRQQPAAG